MADFKVFQDSVNIETGSSVFIGTTLCMDSASNEGVIE